MYKSRIFLILLFVGLILPMAVGTSIVMPSPRSNNRAGVITNPTDGATVSGTVVITTTIKVFLYIDGTRVATRVTSYSWDTTAYSDGSHTIRAYDRRSRTDETITVIVDNSGGEDTIPPTVSITNPGNGATVSGTVSVTASASDNVGVTQVEFYIDGSLKTTDTSSPYSYNWDTTGYSDGSSHSIEAIAYDAAGNNDSDAITVTVDNSAPPTGNKYAIIVGISDYQYISDLSYCDEDATDWYYQLEGMGYDCQIYGDGHTNNYPIYTGTAYESTVRTAIQDLASVAQSGDTVVFTTSGHGSGNGVGSSYLCMYDCSGSQGCYYDTELAADIGLFANGVKIFVFIDHCYAGGMGPELMSLSNSANIYVATTCTENGYGYDDFSHKNGAWTYYFLDASWQQYFANDPHQSMEAIFDYAVSIYPYGGGDTPQEFDGNTSEYFYLD